MHSKGQGLMASLLMFIPLLAVPFVASFGVPWLAAKAKEEGIPLPHLTKSSLPQSSVGHSKTGMHSADDLFAPVAKQAAVDLRYAPPATPAATQNPHLRNASLVVSHTDGWADPFERLNSSPPKVPPPAPEDPLGGWALKDEAAQSPVDDAPLPQEFPEPLANVVESSATTNPFAEFEGNTPSASTPESRVAVLESAFDDPSRDPRLNSDRNPFDPTRPLFKQENSGQNIAPAKASANSGNNVQKSPMPLTFDTARARLNELGITKYYIQQDATGQVFHFHCAYTPPDNPRVTRLFEDHAPDPLEAIRKVLVQVENCTERQPVRPN